MCGEENTSQAASVEFVRWRRTNYARSRLQPLCQKVILFDSLKGCAPLLGARSRSLSDRECLLRVDVSVMIRARRVVRHIIDVGQHAAVIRQRRDGIGIGIADAERPVTPDDTRACDGIRSVRMQQRVAQQSAVAADLIERERRLLPRCARSPECRRCLRVRDRVGRIHVHGRQPRRACGLIFFLRQSLIVLVAIPVLRDNSIWLICNSSSLAKIL